ncbi:MAG TPA: histidinol-phosphatase [Ignavibacteriaceae bacterium]
MNIQNAIVPFIKFLASGSGKIIKSYYRVPINIDIKYDNSPVTAADKKAEEFMRESIMKEFPSHGIVGEEFGEVNPDADYKWVLDPIDGTKSFICGTPLFGTLIALLKNGVPVLGSINLPVLNEFMIGDNSRTTLNDTRVQVRKCSKITDAVLLTTDLNSFDPEMYIKVERLAARVKMLRGWGDCYGYYLVASGYADIMIDPVMSVWDKMALIPVIRGAGGIITTIQGDNPLTGTSILASASEIHSEVVDLLNKD